MRSTSSLAMFSSVSTPMSASTAGWAFDALVREQRGLQALARGVAGVQPLDVAAAVDEGEQPAGARGSEAERIRETHSGKRAELAGGRGRAEHADRGGRVESALA